jgi:hypothetical protein
MPKTALGYTHPLVKVVPGFFPGAKSAGLSCWPLISIGYRGYEWVDLYFCSIPTHPWRGPRQLLLNAARHKLVKYLSSPLYIVGRVAQSVWQLATGWTVRGSNPGGGARFPAPVQTGPGAHPASCTMGTGSFPGVNSGQGVTPDLSPPSSAVVMKG